MRHIPTLHLQNTLPSGCSILGNPEDKHHSYFIRPVKISNRNPKCWDLSHNMCSCSPASALRGAVAQLLGSAVIAPRVACVHRGNSLRNVECEGLAEAPHWSVSVSVALAARCEALMNGPKLNPNKTSGSNRSQFCGVLWKETQSEAQTFWAPFKAGL